MQLIRSTARLRPTEGVRSTAEGSPGAFEYLARHSVPVGKGEGWGVGGWGALSHEINLDLPILAQLTADLTSSSSTSAMESTKQVLSHPKE